MAREKLNGILDDGMDDPLIASKMSWGVFIRMPFGEPELTQPFPFSVSHTKVSSIFILMFFQMLCLPILAVVDIFLLQFKLLY